MDQRFTTFWYIDVPNTPDPYRVYDQVFIDGTYTVTGCLLVAATRTHVICWYWTKSETTAAYTQLLQGLAPPLCVVIDGGARSYSAIKTCWPTTRIHRCLVHTPCSTPLHHKQTTNTGRANSLRPSLTTTRITTTKQATVWVVNLHEFGQDYTSFLNGKTPLPKQRRTATRTREYTHVTVRKAYNCLVNLTRQGFLFTYLEPSREAINPQWASTTNSLEGGINAQLKLIARMHRDRTGKRQRTMMEW